MEYGDYKLDKGRIVISTGGTCPLRCSYCYTYSDGFRRFPRKSPDRIAADIDSFSNRVDLVQLGCDTELFLRQGEAVELIQKVADLGKDVSFATKMNLTDRTIGCLAEVSEKMKTPAMPLLGPDNYLVAFVSLIGFETARRLEPNSPSPEKRIDTIKRLYRAGVPTYVFIRPLLPQVSDDELQRLFDATRDHCDGYVVGKVYYDDESAGRLGLARTKQKKMSWAISQRNWNVTVDHRIAELTKQESVFSSSLEAIDQVRGCSYQEALIEGLQKRDSSTSIFESSMYSVRLSVPDNVKYINVLARKDDAVPGLVLRKNIFTGEVFTAPGLDEIEAIRSFYEGNVITIDQPSNVYLASPRTILLEDGRLFAHNSFIADFDLTEAITQAMTERMAIALRNRDMFIKVCESLEDRIFQTNLDIETFNRVRAATTLR